MVVLNTGISMEYDYTRHWNWTCPELWHMNNDVEKKKWVKMGVEQYI